MEGLIIGFIVMALGALFSQKKTGEETTRPKNPVQTAKQRTVKRAEDYAKEIYGELQNKQPERTRQATKKVQESVADYRSREVQPKRDVPVRESAGRLTSGQERRTADAKPRLVPENVFTLEKDDLKKSIILAEILMPPKSKRR